MIRPKVNKHVLARTYSSGQVQPYELPVTRVSEVNAPDAVKPKRDGRPISIAVRVVMLLALVTRRKMSSPVTVRTVSWSWDDAAAVMGADTHAGVVNSASPKVRCFDLGNAPTIAVVFVLLAIGVADDACGLIWRSRGFSPAFRHAAAMYVALTMAAISDVSQVVAACAAVSCWSLAEASSRACALAWITAWIVPVSALLGVGDRKPVAWSAVVALVLLGECASGRRPVQSRLRAVREIAIEFFIVGWIVLYGQYFRSTLIKCSQ